MLWNFSQITLVDQCYILLYNFPTNITLGAFVHIKHIYTRHWAKAFAIGFVSVTPIITLSISYKRRGGFLLKCCRHLCLSTALRLIIKFKQWDLWTLQCASNTNLQPILVFVIKQTHQTSANCVNHSKFDYFMAKLLNLVCLNAFLDLLVN